MLVWRHSYRITEKRLETDTITNLVFKERWEMVAINIPKTTGVHDDYFVFHSKARKNPAYFNYWKLGK